MTTNATERKTHERVWELLPWYVNNTLSEAEVQEVEHHLQACAACQAELSRWREVASAMRGDRREIWRPSAAHLRSVMKRIDTPPAERPANRLHRLFAWLADTPKPARWALAVQAVLVIALGAGVLLRAPENTGYETLSRAQVGAPAGAQVRLVFADDISGKELRDLVAAVHGSISAGPSPLGVYTIRLANASAAGIAQALATLRAHAKVRLAEPVREE